MLSKQSCQFLFAALQKENPHPQTELHYTTDFELLVAVMLSAQATDASVNKATVHLFPVANTPEALLALGEEQLAHFLKTLNYYRTKTRHLLATAQRLVDHFNSRVPTTREALETLPGVGRKTANVILNVLIGAETFAVDTHIFRVANRTGLAPGKTPLQVELGLMKQVPKPFRQHAHHWLVLHGRYICTAKRPKCEQCPIRTVCEYWTSVAEKNIYVI
ncbi:MAG: endonuclease III [Gammaproteobacteria bacterium RIFCSPHIGHO2_12_FULL_45_9]|nr:MAG: endonuclease III [Gammaproteobacteria bacterium RIFCSPHIGHO2_12_FULL_45_9]